MPTNLPAIRVADEVRAAMARKRVSQTKLADILGISQAAVSRRLTGEVAFDVNELSVLAGALDVSLATLLVAA